MMNRLIRVFSWMVIVFIGACSAAPPPTTTVPDLTFENVKPISLDVSSIDITQSYQPSMAPPYVEHLFKTNPTEAVRALINKRVIAAGGDSLLKVVIEDASVMNEKFQIKQGFWHMFSNEPAERFKARVALRFELSRASAPDIVVAYSDIAADRSKSLFADSSPADRETAFFLMIEELMLDISRSLPATLSYLTNKP